MIFHWDSTNLSYGYFSNDNVNWDILFLIPGRANYTPYNYVMLPPNSVAYFYNNQASPAGSYVNQFVGEYYASANNGVYNKDPINLNGLHVIDFHSDNNYPNYCSCADNNVGCIANNFTIPINNGTCDESHPASIPAPTPFEPPSTTWIWIVVGILAFCSLIVFIFIILVLVGVFKFGKASVEKSAEMAKIDDKSK